jgi:putative FmdB family regulatory protein
MPIYEYQCQKCGTFETTQRITEKPLEKCPKCKSKVKKLISNTSFQLKGTGWYVTDYARKDKGTSKSENGSKSTTESKTESKTESTSSTSKSDGDKSDKSSKSSEKSSSTSSSSTSA